MSNRKNLIDFFSDYKEIRIPRIQRAYAQGRKNEKDIRDNFLEDLFNSLKENDTLELNYVYGNTVKNNENGPVLFELLDGQQRITTLFLLHWYIACREHKLDDNLITTLSKFRYETRHTSSDFCEYLCKYLYVPVEEETPSQTIRKQFKWYFKSFDLDSTIDAMLRMIDSIHSYYNKCAGIKLFDALNRIQFYVLNLDDFGLSEELYIKMNARGLPLTPFENFKADLINYLKNSGLFNSTVDYNGHKMPYYLRIASEIDGKWVGLFWDDDDYLNIDKSEYDENNEEYSVKYFRFFYRYFASTYILKYRIQIKGEEMRKDPDYLFFHQQSEEQKLSMYYRFVRYKDILEALSPKLVYSMEHVLNTLGDHYYKDIKPLLTPVWGDKDNWDFFSPVKQSGFTLQRRIVFAAICEFIEAYKEFDVETFKKWMRVVWNIVSNTDIDSISPATFLERNLSSIIRGAAESGEEFYHFMANYNSRGDDEDNGGERSKSITEEIIKARYIDSNDKWLSLFEEAERHPFCKGMVRFFLRDDGDTPEAFKRRFGYINQMFDEKGITALFSHESDYLLLRAMISCITNWNNIRNRYFTDKVEPKWNALRVMISTPANIHIKNFLCDVLESETIEEVIKKLEEATHRPSNLDTSNLDISLERAIEIHRRLYQESKYIKWMQQNDSFRVYKRDSWYYYGVEYGSSVNLLLLESDRDTFIKRLIDEEGFALINTQNNRKGRTKEDDFNEYGVYFGSNIHLGKIVNGWNLRVVFSTVCKLNVSIECPESEKNQLMAVFGDVSDKAIEDTEPVRRFVFKDIPYHDGVTYDFIYEKLFGAEGVITKLPERKAPDETVLELN